ncbi:hypothetical protein L207DRAFT_576179 [Hyaloscypha variabilis F]|jgi:hypothetical protein|uniref:Uncharacterized protein n=1 Tax=Hyaloscypha variabilis (strain UAMH 11265 / GT02V1 / F) TaxID=1149755 RepID=A0A2J6S9F5_HYAVF|nr:hypothetical protein L207DRAFT_576179 [Hyaloscypha variabilis F]
MSTPETLWMVSAILGPFLGSSGLQIDLSSINSHGNERRNIGPKSPTRFHHNYQTNKEKGNLVAGNTWIADHLGSEELSQVDLTKAWRYSPQGSTDDGEERAYRETF